MADYLWTTFIANNDGQNVLVSTTGPGLTGWTADCDIDQASGFAPSAVYFNGRFRIAFVANNEGQNVLVCSSADGANWSNNEDIHQASESAPSLAVYRGRLYMAFMANNEGQNLLVCSSDDGETWSGTVDIGQATGNSPSLAVYDGLLYVAFMANDDGQNVLVRTYDGKNWSNPNVDIGQATGSAPSLAVYDGLLYVAFMANNDGQNVLVCTYDGKNWSNQNVDIGQATRCAPALAAYNGLLYVAFVANNDEKNILVCTYDGRKWSTPSRDISQASGFAPSLTVAPFSYWSTPPDGLGSNSNYLLYGDGKPLIDVSVTIDITKDMVCQSVGPPPANTCPDLGSGTFGFSFQLIVIRKSATFVPINSTSSCFGETAPVVSTFAAASTIGRRAETTLSTMASPSWALFQRPFCPKDTELTFCWAIRRRPLSALRVPRSNFLIIAAIGSRMRAALSPARTRRIWPRLRLSN
jgi:hypothetical protein